MKNENKFKEVEVTHPLLFFYIMCKLRLSITVLLIVFAFSTASANSSGILTDLDTNKISKSEFTSAGLFKDESSSSAGEEKERILCFANDTVLNIVSTDTTLLYLDQKGIARNEILPVTNNPKKKKWVTAMFAFPFPFGFVGAHRVMLGTKPWIPIVYVATFGGCFGLLPLIDFCVILSSKDIEQYENNPNLFMWIK